MRGGQSNAQFSVNASLNGTAEIVAASYPNIRVFTVGQGTQSQTPLTDLASVEQNWTAATPVSIGNGDFTYFSAICYYTGRDLLVKTGVPLGLISNNWGGTCLQSRVDPGISASCGLTNQVPTMYNAMVVPYLVGPMAVSGFLWSQGECNADFDSVTFYACAFPLFIDSWRTLFGVPDAFFAFELLPAYTYDSTFSPQSLPFERQAQLAGLGAKGHNVVVANGIDLGDVNATYGSVQPRNKTEVGRRFVAAALELMYGQPTAYLPPTYASAAAVTTGISISVTVSFTPASVGVGGLLIVPSACLWGVNATECAWTELQTSDGV